MATAKKSSFLAQHWFLIALVTVLPVGVICWQPLAIVNRFTWPRTLLVCLVMGLMALPIPFELIRRSLARPWPAILASLINMGLIPALAAVAALSMPDYLGGGLIVAAAIPCTLASAAVWTRRAGGDDTVAILVTLITNITCVLVTPLWLVGLLGRQVNLQVAPLVYELTVVVLLPICVAQLLRKSRQIADWSQRHKLSLAIFCQIGILIMVLSGAIEMGRHLAAPLAPIPTTSSTAPNITADAVPTAGHAIHSVSALQIVWTVLVSALIHLLAMGLAWHAAGGTKVARPQQVGVAIAGSQKTLMIGLKMALDCGVSIIPMVAFHVGQLILDTFIADWLRKGAAERRLPD